MTGRRTVLVLPVLFGIVAVACQDPTEVVVEVRTDVSYRSGIVTAFTAGSPGETETADPSTETNDAWGADGFVGSLVLVPGSGKSASLSVKVVMGIRRATHECVAPLYQGCIVARRKLLYRPHERLVLPIAVYANCVDIPCDANSTCNILGQCVSSSIDANPDLGEGFPDAGTDRDGSADVGADAGNAGDAADAADAGDGATAPGTVRCAGMTCPAGDACCLDERTSPATGHCIRSADSCAGMETKLMCDDRGDCSGAHCCIVSMLAACMAQPCPQHSELCSSSADCSGEFCQAASGGYSLCP